MKDFKEGGYAAVIRERRRGEMLDAGDVFYIERVSEELLYLAPWTHTWVRKDRCIPITRKEYLKSKELRE